MVELLLQNLRLLLPANLFARLLPDLGRRNLTVAAPVIRLRAGDAWLGLRATDHYGPVSVLGSIHVASV